jgi:hypothetical protein
MQILTKTLEEYVELRLDLLQILKIRDKSKFLKPKPRKFFVQSVIINAQGMDINTTDAVEELRRRMNWKMNDDVYTYRHKMKKLGWWVLDPTNKSKYKIHPTFDFKGKTIPAATNYQFSLNYEIQQ